MATGLPPKVRHQGAGTIPPEAAPLSPHGTTSTLLDASRLPRRIRFHKSLPSNPADTNSGSLEGNDWPLTAPKNISEHQTLEPISLSGLSDIDPIAVSSFDRAVDDNNVHVRRLCHSSSSAASTGTGPVLRIAADAGAVIFGTADEIPPVPTVPTVPSYIPKDPSFPSKIPTGTSIPSKIPKISTHQSSSGTFRDHVLKATEPKTSPSITPPVQKTWQTGLMTEMGSGTKINPIRSMKPARKLSLDGSSPMSPSPLAQPSVVPSTTDQVSAVFSNIEVATRDLDEPTKLAASTSQFNHSVGRCVSAWSSSSPSSQATHSHNTVGNQDFNMTRATETATFNIVDSSSSRKPPQRHQSDDSDEQLHEHPDEQLQEYSDDPDEQSDDSDEESDEQLDEQLAAPPAAPFPMKDMPSKKNQSTLQKVKGKRSIRDIFSRSKSRVNLVEEAPPPLPNKQGFLSAFQTKSHAKLSEETRPAKQGFFSVIRSKSRVNLGDTAPPTGQDFINATSSPFAEAMPNPNGHFMPSTPPEVTSRSASPVRKPAPKDPETRRTELLESIARLAQKPNNPARGELHLCIAKAMKEVVKSSNNAELAEANAIQKSVHAAGDAKQAQEWADLAEESSKKSKQYAEQADHYAGRAETWAKNAALMAREASISRIKAEKHNENAQKHLKELWELLEAAGLEGDERLTIEELARELVNYRNPWTE